MEWVETTGRTIDEAKDAALDQLGVDETDAEFEVLEEPRGGLFGRLRSEARVRARVRPTKPPPKLDRRDRRRRRRAEGEPAGDAGGADVERGPARPGGREDRGSRGGRRGGRRSGTTGERRPERAAVTRPGPGVDMDSGEGSEMSEAPDLEEQAGIVGDFVQGLVDAFGLDATVTHQAGDDEDGSVEVHVDGDHLGLLIGPRGHSLEAIQELARTVLQRHTVGAPNARVRIDVAGYRQRRREALERFALQVAEEAKAAGVRKVLEPMNAADRKVVHDAVNDIEGVSTTSEGEDPRRRVVIVPDAPANTAPADTAPADAAPADIGPADIGPADTGPADIAPADAAPADTAPADIGPDDAGLDES